MNPVAEKEEFVSTFVRRLRDLDSGERARFKRNAGAPISESHNVAGLFYKKLLFDRTLSEAQEEIYFLVATLYPFEKQPKQKPEGESEPPQRPENFGVSLGEVRRRLERNKAGSANGLDNRFERLLDAGVEQLPFYLRREVHFLINADGRMDWQHLLRDLLRWDYPDRRVQRNWARAYFAASSQDESGDKQINE